MPAHDLKLLIDAARQAGRIATAFSGKSARRWDKPDGEGLVTEADIAVNNALMTHLRKARPDYGWLSEETDDNSDRLTHEHVFIVDPIDGTRSFAEGARTWAHAIAVACRGQVTAAVIYLPLRDMLFHAQRGQGAYLNDEPITVAQCDDLRAADILAARPNLDPRFWRNGAVPRFNRAYRPSIAFRMASVASGRFDGMLTLRPSWEWDIAAGDLILREAGAVCTDRNGRALVFNNPVPKLDGVIAGNRYVHGQLSQALITGDTQPWSLA